MAGCTHSNFMLLVAIIDTCGPPCHQGEPQKQCWHLPSASDEKRCGGTGAVAGSDGFEPWWLPGGLRHRWHLPELGFLTCKSNSIACLEGTRYHMKSPTPGRASVVWDGHCWVASSAQPL